MVKFLLVFFGVALFSTGTVAQVGTWQEVNHGLSPDLSSIFFTTNDTGFVFGLYGLPNAHLFQTVDSGKDLSSVMLPSPVQTAAGFTDMSWPTPKCGYMVLRTSTSTALLRTNDAGLNWTLSYPGAGLSFFNISFPTPTVGFATGQFTSAGGEYFAAKSTDSGITWQVVYRNILPIGKVFFKSATDGIFFLSDIANNPQVAYTFDSLKNVTVSPALSSSAASTPGFLHWNDDNSWIAGYEGLQRSTDSGRTWSHVVQNQAPNIGYGEITSACFHHRRGFAFPQYDAVVFATTDYGATWTASHFAHDTLQSNFCSMPTSTAAYVMGLDSAAEANNPGGNNTVLLKITLPIDSTEILHQGLVASAVPQDRFHVVVEGTGISFTVAAVAEARRIDILDLLGRECASLAPMSTTTELARSRLRPGSYFARLGNEMVKFAIVE